jgi:hypothetical protein
MTTKDSLEFIYNITKESLSAQQTQKITLESKVNTLVGFSGGMLVILLGFKETLQNFQPIAKLLIITSVCFFLLSIFLATIVGWVRKYRSDPNPNTLAENYLNRPEKDVKLQTLANLIGTWKSNANLLERNAVILRLAMATQTIGFLLLGIVLILFLK